MSAHTRTNTTTHFLREPRGLALVASQLGRTPRVWCAGCSTGDEPYSMVIGCLAAGVDVQVVASDVNPLALAAAERGEYPSRHLRHVPLALRERWFEPLAGGRHRVRDEVRARVRFVPANLLQDEAPGAGFDAVFCRNVMVYFRRPEMARAVARMTAALAPGGILVIGASEWLAAEVRSPELQLEELDGVMVYRRGGRSEPARLAPMPLPAMAWVPEPGPPAPSPPMPAPAPAVDPVAEQRGEGDRWLDRGAVREARACYQAALRRAPLLADLHLRLALTHLHDVAAPAEPARRAALEALRRCLFLAPELWPAWILVAELSEASDPRAARAALEQARALLAAPKPVAPPAQLAGFFADERTARDAVARRMGLTRGP